MAAPSPRSGTLCEMLIADSLQSLFQEINQARDEQDLRSRVIISLGEYFAAKRCGLFFFDQFPQAAPNSNLAKLALSIEHNPVLRYVVERHAVIHEASLLPPGVWEKLCSRTDHAHVMAGPIVSNGQLVGGLGFTRTRHQPTFNDQNLADLSALCLHVSTWLAIMRSPLIKFNPLNIDRLTPREIQIAQLVARGLTNAEIGSNSLDYRKFCQAGSQKDISEAGSFISCRDGSTAFSKYSFLT